MAIKETFESVVKTVKETIGMETEETEGGDLGFSGGEYKRKFLKELEEQTGRRIEEQGVRPHVEIWPFDDEDAQWYASHRDKPRTIICNTPEFKDMPFCGSGHH